jgi:hypothetical protein
MGFSGGEDHLRIILLFIILIVGPESANSDRLSKDLVDYSKHVKLLGDFDDPLMLLEAHVFNDSRIAQAFTHKLMHDVIFVIDELSAAEICPRVVIVGFGQGLKSHWYSG